MEAKKMRLSFLTIMLLFCTSIFSQQFQCEKMHDDIKKWNEIKQPKNNTKWANAIVSNKLFQQNSDGSLEYVYIFNSTDSFNIETIRKISFDFIGYEFPNLDNATRADMQTNSPKNGLIFKGKILKLGIFNGMMEVNQIHGNVLFDIRFKPNRIRFSIKIQNYQVVKANSAGLAENYIEYINKCFPLNQESNHKKSFAMAFINANSNCLNYTKKYLDYLNTHIKESQPTDEW